MTAYQIEGGETLTLRASENFKAANTELKKAFGFGMRVLTPYGGGRTPAQQQELIHRGMTRTMNSDHMKYVAVDVDNIGDFRRVNAAKFKKIMNAWGWRNIQVNGLPFPSEPWHWVNDNRKRVNTDPNPDYQVYYCTGYLSPDTGKLLIHNAEGQTVKGWYYEVGKGYWRRTRINARKNYWVRKFGYGGSRTYQQLEAIKASGKQA